LSQYFLKSLGATVFFKVVALVNWIRAKECDQSLWFENAAPGVSA
jgi:hypothetical protein